MTVVHEPLTMPDQGRASWWQLPEIWGTLGILIIWLAVLFVGVYGGDMRFASNDGNASSIPVVVVVAVCALPATAAVTKRAFRR